MLKLIWTLLYNYLLHFIIKDKTIINKPARNNRIKYLLQQYNKYINKKYPIRIKRVEQNIKHSNLYYISNNILYCSICGPTEDEFFEQHYRFNNKIYCSECYSNLIALVKYVSISYNKVVATMYLGNRDSRCILSKIPEILITQIIYYLK